MRAYELINAAFPRNGKRIKTGKLNPTKAFEIRRTDKGYSLLIAEEELGEVWPDVPIKDTSFSTTVTVLSTLRIEEKKANG